MHVGIIADGNGRWAERRGLPRVEGHEAGAANISKVVDALEGKVDYLTLFGFSTENWNRPKEEVDALFGIMERYLVGPLGDMYLDKGMRFHHFGSREGLPEGLLRALDKLRIQTRNNGNMHIGFCLNYGSRFEIEAAARLWKNHENFSFRDCLNSHMFPDVDLIVRTGGEQRLSNFLLYQSAYAEIYFTQTLFPDLDKEELDIVLAWYKSRKRTFGKV